MGSSLIFSPAKRAVPAPAVAAEKPWTVIVADDEVSVHDVTVLALDGFQFEGRAVRLVHAYSGAEALAQVAEHPDAAAILLDVVMETEHAGLDVAREIRETLQNRKIRVVLRTGQPGTAPESEVVARFDINDYKEKSELTARRLYTVIFACLRAYRDIAELELAQRGLERVVAAAPGLMALGNIESFPRMALTQLASLVRTGRGDPVEAGRDGVVAGVDQQGDYRVIVGIGRFTGTEGKTIDEVLPSRVATSVRNGPPFETSGILELYPSPDGRENLLYLEAIGPLKPIERQILSIYCRTVGIAFGNLRSKEEIEEIRQDVVERLALAVEGRSAKIGYHTRRVGEGCAILGAALGLGDGEIDLLRRAAPLHDLGELGIPDRILRKPGPLNAEEWDVMRGHPATGHDLLSGTGQPLLDAAAIIALDHHEHWDGTGYPKGKRGDAIHIFGRICAVVDVFDSLTSRRPYREAWELPRVLAHLREHSGRHFDPAIVDRLFDRLDAMITLRIRYPDPS
jgi:response regulator RpfG family c-di-GMP phosphodiesterase